MNLNYMPADVTPLPWEAHAVNDGFGAGGLGVPITASGLAVGRVWETRDPVMRISRAEQNAVYLVHAANTYPELVQALRDAIKFAESNGAPTMHAARGVLRVVGETYHS